MAANGRLEGQVVDSVLGLQADGIRVTATNEDGDAFSAETSSGGFQFLDIPLGLYTVEFEDCDGRGFASRTFTDVTPNPGSLGSLPYICLRRTHGFVVEGRVTDRYVAAQLKDVTTGCRPTTFCPDDNVTRGQMAAFLRRALDT